MTSEMVPAIESSFESVTCCYRPQFAEPEEIGMVFSLRSSSGRRAVLSCFRRSPA